VKIGFIFSFMFKLNINKINFRLLLIIKKNLEHILI